MDGHDHPSNAEANKLLKVIQVMMILKLYT